MKDLSCAEIGFPNQVTWSCYYYIIIYAGLWDFSPKMSGWMGRWHRGGDRSDEQVRPYLYLPAGIQCQLGPSGMTPSPLKCEEQLTSGLSIWFQPTCHRAGKGHTALHRSCLAKSPSATWQTWILLLSLCSSKWTHCLLIYLYQVFWKRRWLDHYCHLC